MISRWILDPPVCYA